MNASDILRALAQADGHIALERGYAYDAKGGTAVISAHGPDDSILMIEDEGRCCAVEFGPEMLSGFMLDGLIEFYPDRSTGDCLVFRLTARGRQAASDAAVPIKASA
jgi:hypothetical protein